MRADSCAMHAVTCCDMLDGIWQGGTFPDVEGAPALLGGGLQGRARVAIMCLWNHTLL